MTVPDWRTFKAGARVRVALWLHSEVGEGGTFTKAHLRDAFPNVEQIDRRMRDLRPEGWILATYREDRSLTVDELRVVTEGGRVWERGYRSKLSSGLTDKQRREIFAADNFACALCGVAGGEPYFDDPLRAAKLTVARLTDPSSDKRLHQTMCDRCHVAFRDGGEVDNVIPDVLDLTLAQQNQLRSWIQRGARTWSAEERIWARYRRLPLELRLEVQASLQSD